MLTPIRALVDPLSKFLNFLGRKGLVGMRRRHSLVGVLGQDAADHLTRARFSRDNRSLSGVGLGERTFTHIQPQATFAPLFVRPVTPVATIHKDGPNVTAVIDRPLSTHG